MTKRSLSSSFHHMTNVLSTRDAAELADAELVDRFVADRNEVAFSALVRRYGILVLGVCRRILRNEHDAEDAFQATFLILAQKAPQIRRIGQLGNWLYGVAYNVSRKAKTYRHRREVKELEAASRQSAIEHADFWTGLQEILDQELYGLADKYRTPIVLCDLRGLTIQEAAIQIGCLPKTLGTRLSRGRAILATRLSKRGVAISVGALAAAFSSNATSLALAAISPQLVGKTNRLANLFLTDSSVVLSPAIAALTRGVSNVMMSKSLKFAVGLSCCVLISSGLARHLTATAAVEPTERIAASDRSTLTPVKKEIAPQRKNHFERFKQHLSQLLSWIGMGDSPSEAPSVAASDEKNDKDKPTLTGIWVRKEGDFSFQFDFTDKGTLKITFMHGDKGGTITCEYSSDKDGLVKGKITQVEGVEQLKEKLPVGSEFKFKWKIKEKAALLDDVESEKAPIMKHLEGQFEEKK